MHFWFDTVTMVFSPLPSLLPSIPYSFSYFLPFFISLLLFIFLLIIKLHIVYLGCVCLTFCTQVGLVALRRFYPLYAFLLDCFALYTVIIFFWDVRIYHLFLTDSTGRWISWPPPGHRLFPLGVTRGTVIHKLFYIHHLFRFGNLTFLGKFFFILVHCLYNSICSHVCCKSLHVCFDMLCTQ